VSSGIYYYLISIPIIERLLKLLDPAGDVQEQVITTLAMVTDPSEVTPAKVSKRRCGGKGIGDMTLLPFFFV